MELSLSQQELEEFFAFLSIPSVAADSAQMLNAAKWLAQRLKKAGADPVKLLSTRGYPLVYGELAAADGNAPTVLIYGHYDVQPADTQDGWSTRPFEPVLKDGKIYARGASDCKGGIYAAILAVEQIVKHGDGKPPVHLKFLFEGEEESGSASLRDALLEYRELFGTDLILSIDGCGAGADPVIRSGFKGICGLELELTGAAGDLHSGMAGQMVHNPVQVLCDILSSMKLPDGKIAIAGFYEDVTDITEEEKKVFASAASSDEQYKEAYGVDSLFGEHGYTPTERLFARPTMDINGIWGGFAEKGVKNIIPAKAGCKLSFRLVHNQDPDKVYEQAVSHIRTRLPAGITASITPYAGANKAYVLPLEHPGVQALQTIHRQIYGREPKFIRSGGTLPISTLFLDIFGKHLIGFGPYSFVENVHGPNEYVVVEHLTRIKMWLPTLLEELKRRL